MTTAPADFVKSLAPSGTLRAAINTANPVLVQRNPITGAPMGVTIDLAQELRSGSQCRCSKWSIDGAGKSFDAVKTAACDIGFLAVEPARASEIDFTAPYVIIEGVYAVRADGPVKSNDDVDRAGVRVAVNKAAAYDLFLTRSLKHATLVRAEEFLRHVPARGARSGRRREAGRGALRRGEPGGAAAARPLHGDPAGDVPAQGPRCRRRLSARVRRGDEGVGLCRAGDRAGRAGGDGGACCGVTFSARVPDATSAFTRVFDALWQRGAKRNGAPLIRDPGCLI